VPLHGRSQKQNVGEDRRERKAESAAARSSSRQEIRLEEETTRGGPARLLSSDDASAIACHCLFALVIFNVLSVNPFFISLAA
jgi:hypothetical protein